MCKKWKIEYDTHILKGDLDLAKNIKDRNLNRKFYKYRCFDDKQYWVDWIKGIIFLNSPNNFNDPFDCLINVSQETSKLMFKDSIIKYFETQKIKLKKVDFNRLMYADDLIEVTCIILEQHGRKVNRTLLDRTLLERYTGQRSESFLRETLRVSCFSEIKDSILMWSHYANYHQGFCIEYNFSNDEHITDLLFPVVYNVERYKILPQFLKNKNLIIPTILCKAPEWSYEQEWRYANIINPELCNHLENPTTKLSTINAIKAIYLGADAIKYNEAAVNELKQIAKSRNIAIYEMKFDEYEYKLIPESIDH